MPATCADHDTPAPSFPPSQPPQLDSLIDTSKGQFALLDALNYLSDQPRSLYRHNGALRRFLQAMFALVHLASPAMAAASDPSPCTAPLAPQLPSRPPPFTSAVLNLGYIRTKLPSAPGQVPEDQWRLADPDQLEECHTDLLLNQTDRLVMVRWRGVLCWQCTPAADRPARHDALEGWAAGCSVCAAERVGRTRGISAGGSGRSGGDSV